MIWVRRGWSASLLAILSGLGVRAQSTPEALELLARADEPVLAAQTVQLSGDHTFDFGPGRFQVHRASSFIYERDGAKVRIERREGNFNSLDLFDGNATSSYRSRTATYSDVPGRHLNPRDIGLNYIAYGRSRAHVLSARVTREEQVVFAGGPVRCYVVTASYLRCPGGPRGAATTRTVWIAADSGLVLRDNWVTEYTWRGHAAKAENRFRYSIIEWDIPLAAKRFRFVPPPGSRAEGSAPTLDVVAMRLQELPLPPVERIGYGNERRVDDRVEWIVSARGLIQNTFHLTNASLPELPEWADSEFYDVELNAVGIAAPALLFRTQRQLLRQRFALRSHFETREVPLYTLSLAAGGFIAPKSAACIPDVPPLNCGKITTEYMAPALRLQGRSVTVADLAQALRVVLDSKVRDRSGVTDRFDVDLPADGLPVDVAALNRTLEQNFGLKLEFTKGPARVLVVDKLERPFGRAGAAVTLPPSHISIAGGVAGHGKMLSVVEDGSSASLAAADDNSGRQRWQFQPGRNTGWYNILVADGVAGGRKYLSVRAGGSAVDLVAADDGSGRQRWFLESDEAGLFRIRTLAMAADGRKYLSVTPDGRRVHLSGADDGAGRHRWRIEKIASPERQDLRPQGSGPSWRSYQNNWRAN